MAYDNFIHTVGAWLTSARQNRDEYALTESRRATQNWKACTRHGSHPALRIHESRNWFTEMQMFDELPDCIAKRKRITFCDEENHTLRVIF